MEKYTGKIMRITIQSSFRALNFVLAACRPNFATVACSTGKVEQACRIRYFVSLLVVVHDDDYGNV